MPLTLTLFHICFIYASTYSAYFEMLLSRFLPRFNDNISAAISRRTKCFESPHNALQTSFWYFMYIYILFTPSLVFNCFAGCMSWNCSSLLLVYILCIFKNSNLIFLENLVEKGGTGGEITFPMWQTDCESSISATLYTTGAKVGINFREYILPSNEVIMSAQVFTINKVIR